MGSELNGMISVLITGCGLYILYSYFSMKKTRVISETLLSGKNPGKKCKDKEAFLNESLPHVLLLGAASLIYGCVDMYNNFIQSLGMVDVVVSFIFVVALIWYIVMTQKIKKKYY